MDHVDAQVVVEQLRREAEQAAADHRLAREAARKAAQEAAQEAARKAARTRIL